MSSDKGYIAITMGDAAGIGPEVILKSLENYHPQFSRVVVVGGYEIFLRAAQVLNSSLVLKKVQNPDEGDYQNGMVNILDTEEPLPEQVPFGKVSPAAGRGSVLAVRKAHQISLNHPVKALISAPIHKQAMKEAGFTYSDECELMSDLTGAPTPMMFLISDNMRMATLFPLHVSLKKACENVSAEGVLRSLGFVQESLVSFGITKPSIAVAALNPHGGEGGMLGDEEVREIIPGIEAAQKKGWDVRGPFPADTLFFRASKGEFDALLTMYHDQGRIAMKTMDFGRIIIAMIGVPVLFLTVAHGTAHDIAGKGTADPSNLIHVLQFADKVKS